jgi:hypothetical protein
MNNHLDTLITWSGLYACTIEITEDTMTFHVSE